MWPKLGLVFAEEIEWIKPKWLSFFPEWDKALFSHPSPFQVYSFVLYTVALFVCYKTALKVQTPHIIVRILSNLYQWLKFYLFHFKFNYCCCCFWTHTQPELRVLILDRCSEITLTSAPGSYGVLKIKPRSTVVWYLSGSLQRGGFGIVQ